MEDKNIFISLNQYHGCWWLGADGARASAAIVLTSSFQYTSAVVTEGLTQIFVPNNP